MGSILRNNRRMFWEILNRIMGRKKRIIGTGLDPAPDAHAPRSARAPSSRGKINLATPTISNAEHKPCISRASALQALSPFSHSHQPFSRLAPSTILRLLPRGRDKSQEFPLFEGFRCREILGPSTTHVYTATHRVHACARLVRDLTAHVQYLDCACAQWQAVSVFQTEHGTWLVLHSARGGRTSLVPSRPTHTGRDVW